MAMSKGLASTRTLTDIGNAIRFQNGESRRYAPGEMADAIEALDGTKSGEGAQYPYSGARVGMMTVVPYTSIANAIRSQNGSWDEYKPRDMAAAIRALAWPEKQAYAVAVPDAANEGKYVLRFMRAEAAPVVGGIYKGNTIAYVYSGFEDAVYTSNSKVPWYAQHDLFSQVVFDDAVKPASCAYWFYWFRYCTIFDLDLLDTSEVTSLAYMFYSCSALVSLNLSGFVTSNVTNINYMFYNCQKLTYLYFGAWDMHKLDVAAQAFRNLTALVALDLSGWTMPEYTSTMQCAFYNCSKLERIYVPAGCDLSDTAVAADCFKQCAKLVGGAGTAYSVENVTAGMARVDGLDGKPGYFTAR